MKSQALFFKIGLRHIYSADRFPVRQPSRPRSGDPRRCLFCVPPPPHDALLSREAEMTMDLEARLAPELSFLADQRWGGGTEDRGILVAPVQK